MYKLSYDHHLLTNLFLSTQVCAVCICAMLIGPEITEPHLCALHHLVLNALHHLVLNALHHLVLNALHHLVLNALHHLVHNALHHLVFNALHHHNIGNDIGLLTPECSKMGTKPRKSLSRNDP